MGGREINREGRSGWGIKNGEMEGEGGREEQERGEKKALQQNTIDRCQRHLSATSSSPHLENGKVS